MFAMGMSQPVAAQLAANASVTGQFESNSNVFNLQSGTAQPGTNDFRRSDSFLAYGAAFDAKYRQSRQELYANATASEYEFQRLTQLNHNDYDLNAGGHWQTARIFDGTIDVLRRRAMVPFFDLDQQVLALQTEQRETAELGIKITSNWRIDGKTYLSVLDEPILKLPNLQLREKSGSATLNYTEITGLTAGLVAAYKTGDYRGGYLFDNPSYRQSDIGLVATYQPTGRTTIDGQVDYSRRASATGADSHSGLTGHLAFKDQLTPKTAVSVQLSRQFFNYVVNGGSEVDSGADLKVTWRTSHKLTVDAGYTYTLRSYPGQGNNPLGSDRTDHQQYLSLRINYQILPWLLIRPYANVLKRSSDFVGGEFDSTIFGVFVTLTEPLTRSENSKH